MLTFVGRMTVLRVGLVDGFGYEDSRSEARRKVCAAQMGYSGLAGRLSLIVIDGSVVASFEFMGLV